MTAGAAASRPRRLRRLVASLQAWWLRLFVLAIVVAVVASLPVWLDLLLGVSFVALSLVRPPRRDDHPPVLVSAPVAGRWAALNSPATTIPSHGVRAYGQAFAIDLAHPRPVTAAGQNALGWGLRQRRPESYSSFGEPVTAVQAGTVVGVSAGQRDHLARNTWPGVLYLMVLEGFVRELAGSSFIVGNHVVVDHGDGIYALYAHLRAGSVKVRVGDRVAAGEQVGEVGNSGNSSEPHLHFQLMDHRRPAAAAGVPFRWDKIVQDPTDVDPTWSAAPVDAVIVPGLPSNGQVFVAPSRETLIT